MASTSDSDDVTSQWMTFFEGAGIPVTICEKYASIFKENRIRKDMLLDLNKAYLNDMGITIMGDVIAILKKAKTQQTVANSDENINTRLEAIRQSRLAARRSKETTSECSVESAAPDVRKKRKLSKLKITVGLKKNVDGVSVQVRVSGGGGTKKIEIEQDITYQELLKKLQTIFQVTGGYLASFDGTKIEVNNICEYLKTHSRVYIVCQGVEGCEETASGEEAAEECEEKPAECAENSCATVPEQGTGNELVVPSLIEVLDYVKELVVAENVDQFDENLSGGLKDVDRDKYTPVRCSQDPSVVLFIEVQNNEYDRVDSGWGEHVLFTKEDFQQFNQFRAVNNCEALVLKSPALIYFIHTFNITHGFIALTNSVFQLLTDLKRRFEEWLGALKHRVGGP